MRQQVQGIGGVFFKARGDRQALLAWYRDHLGIDFEAWGGKVFGTPDHGMVWSIFKPDTDYFGPTAPLMINYVVADLDAMLAQLRADGVRVDDDVMESELGRFGWCWDPEGNRVELWQRPATPPPG